MGQGHTFLKPDSADTNILIGDKYLFEKFREVSRSSLERFAELGLRRDVKFDNLETLFLALSRDKRSEIVQEIERSLSLLEDISHDPGFESPKDFKFPLSSEIQSLKKTLQKRGMKAADPGIYDLIEDGDIVEVYDARAIQIYRSWSCLQFCRYSLPELLVHDWNTLYERPSWVISQLKEIAPRLFVPGASTVAYEFPEYLLTERLLDDKTGFMFAMKYASSVLSTENGAPVALISTGRIRFVPEVDVQMQVSFL